MRNNKMEKQCNACGEEFTETGGEFCPFCGSSNIEMLEDDGEDTDAVLGVALAELIYGG